jgi:hypothetical protein
MVMKMRCQLVILTLLVGLGVAPAVFGGRERFETPKNGNNLGLWRITNDPTVRDHANYHNTQCWSPDGRFLCYTHWGGREDKVGGKTAAEVHIYDLHKDGDRLVGQGVNPRWAKQRNWLFYAHFNPEAGPLPEKGTEIMWFDLGSGEHRRLAFGVEVLGETDADDQWLYGARRFRGETREYRTVRISIRPDARVEDLPDVTGLQLLPNPRYPLFFTRKDHRDQPFGPTRYWYDLDGRNQRIAVPTLQQCHMCWLGNGEYMLLGNGLIRGRRWNEPFPSNLHILASMSVGDVSPCGRSGRYACGDHIVADLRSGDGWLFIHPLSIVCYPVKIADNSDIYDADPKGSPDGTKVCLVSNYDLKDGPLTFIAENASPKDNALHVQSTEGFPDSGSLVVHREVIGYRGKTPTTFERLARRLHDTQEAALGPGRPVTSFEARCLTEEQWKRLPGPSPSMRQSIDDVNSPLIRQRQTDVYVVWVRRPDRPCLRLAGAEAQLIPGEEHYETFGYHVLRNDRKITQQPLRPGSNLELAEPGEYRAVAVEWSGLESEHSPPLRIGQPVKLAILAEPPRDFSWTRDRWLVSSGEVSPEDAKRAPEAIREIVHLHDGIIHREWYRLGVVAQRHDLNKEGKAIRRLTYKEGNLALREYYGREGNRLSQESFAPDGYITEWVRFKYAGDRALEDDRWWYDRGMPIRRLLKQREEYHKQGQEWVLTGKEKKP